MNKKRLKENGVWDKIWREGVELLNFACDVCRWQHEQGRTFVLEHPWSASSWREHRKLKDLMGLLGVERVRGDLCQFDLRVGAPGTAPSMKPTGFLSNSPEMLRELAKTCKKEHAHFRLEGGHNTKAAEIYPPKLVKALLRGAATDIENQ